MKKVLILEGSPRLKGNSCILSDEFARSAEEAGYTVEKIPVARKKVAGCLGCNACYRNDGICVQKDDMAEIREKMLEADVIVLASPIYFYSMTAQMKAVIDRTYAFFFPAGGQDLLFHHLLRRDGCSIYGDHAGRSPGLHLLRAGFR